MTFGQAASGVFTGIAVAVAAGLAACVGESIQADGHVEYCRIKTVQQANIANMYHLIGFRPWRPDTTIVVTQTLTEAVQAAAAINCPLNKPTKDTK